jgi:hypothetical protein
MGTALRVLAVIVVVGILAGLGVTVYNAGVSQGMVQGAGLATASGAPAVAYGWYGVGPHWGWGFPLFGIFFWILGIFLVFALLRAVFGWGRWGRRGWDDHGPGWGGPGPGGYGGPSGRRDAMERFHRELHERADVSGGPGNAPGPTAG